MAQAGASADRQESSAPSAIRFVMVNRFYRPDHSATAQMLADLAEHLAGEGHEVEIITSRLTYDGATRLPASDTINAVKVKRIWTSGFGRANLVGRSIDYLTFYLSAFGAMLSRLRPDDVLIAKTDPPLISVPAALAARIRGARLVNWCQDLFPEVAGALGVGWARGALGGLLRRIRNASLKAASFNAVLHDTMAERLIAEGIEREKISVLENWADTAIHPIAPEDNLLRQEWGLADRFVISYSGNLGRAHMPGKIAELVARTIDIEDVAWLFIGGGAGIDQLRSKLGGHPDLHFRPYQKREDLSLSLSVGDAHLVSLDPACEGLIVPSKMYGVIAVNRPIIALCAGDGAVAREIGASGSGVWLDPDAPEDWPDEIGAFIDRQKSARRSDGEGAEALPGARAAIGNWTQALRRTWARTSSGDAVVASRSGLAR